MDIYKILNEDLNESSNTEFEELLEEGIDYLESPMYDFMIQTENFLQESFEGDYKIAASEVFLEKGLIDSSKVITTNEAKEKLLDNVTEGFKDSIKTYINKKLSKTEALDTKRLKNIKNNISRIKSIGPIKKTARMKALQPNFDITVLNNLSEFPNAQDFKEIIQYDTDNGTIARLAYCRQIGKMYGLNSITAGYTTLYYDSIEKVIFKDEPSRDYEIDNNTIRFVDTVSKLNVLNVSDIHKKQVAFVNDIKKIASDISDGQPDKDTIRSIAYLFKAINDIRDELLEYRRQIISYADDIASKYEES